ncbi:MAG: CDP-diacylglycerol--glycerol-3-phosphate 3-phosphatidyltransferase [Candidatus Saganbacteria bacterium]|nr:CDP-diacylglycerol--glycerol-3-phosphate 3-phosphatidyltransferase [Candidatus Saganbacteria bacterium]
MIRPVLGVTQANRITLVRVLLIPLFIYFLLSTSLPLSKWIAAGLFIALASTDALDGFVARKYGQVTELGKLIDPIADKMLVYAAFMGFVQMGKLWSWVVLIIVMRDFAVMGLRVWAAKKGEIIPAGDTGKWKTALQMTAIVFLILDWPAAMLLFLISLILCVVSGFDYFRQADLSGA